jgi:hypothetical protein
MTESDEILYPVYDEFINSRVNKVQNELAKGNISSLASLRNVVKRISKFHDSVEAYGFFINYCPYKWEHHVTASIVEKHKFDLESIALTVVNMVVYSDVYELVTTSECTRFLKGNKKKKSIVLKSGEKVIFDEFWKSEADQFNPLTIFPTKYERRKLQIFKKSLDEPLHYIMEHSDPALVWIGNVTIPAPNQGIDYFKQNMIMTLQKYEFPVCEIENTKVQQVSDFEDFGKQVSFNPLEEFDLHYSQYVLSHIDDGIFDVVSGFNDSAQFDIACETMASYLRENFI